MPDLPPVPSQESLRFQRHQKLEIQGLTVQIQNISDEMAQMKKSHVEKLESLAEIHSQDLENRANEVKAKVLYLSLHFTLP